MNNRFCACTEGCDVCRPDWSTAPEGATHWATTTADYHASWYRCSDGGWSGMTVDGYREFKEQCAWYWYGLTIHRTDLEARP